MGHIGGSGSGGFSRPTNFTEAEMRVMWENAILIPPAWHLPHGRHVSAAGYAIPPIPKGTELGTLIGRSFYSSCICMPTFISYSRQRQRESH
jgi:hypothetical protein